MKEWEAVRSHPQLQVSRSKAAIPSVPKQYHQLRIKSSDTLDYGDILIQTTLQQASVHHQVTCQESVNIYNQYLLHIILC